jgi:hypothetical protein
MSDQAPFEQPTQRISIDPQPPSASSSHDGLKVARQWFHQSDNVLMAITAVVAVVFLLLVGTLG